MHYLDAMCRKLLGFKVLLVDYLNSDVEVVDILELAWSSLCKILELGVANRCCNLVWFKHCVVWSLNSLLAERAGEKTRGSTGGEGVRGVAAEEEEGSWYGG